MRKTILMSLVGVMLLSSCYNTESGVHNGAMFGSIIGSAIGGIAGGPRGSDIGTLAGMIGGAAVGAAVGSAKEQAEREKYEEYIAQRRQSRAQQEQDAYDYGQGLRQEYEDAGNDIIEFDPDDGMKSGTGIGRRPSRVDEHESVVTKSATMRRLEGSSLEIRNARLLDANHDGVLTRGEEARMVFEIFNRSSHTVYNVQPAVAELTGNSHIHVSQNVLVESIAPGKGIRYTAVIKADRRLRDGEAVIRIGVYEGNRQLHSQVQEFPIVTRRQ